MGVAWSAGTLNRMWRPTTVDELKARLRAGDLEETQTFDGKRELGSDNAGTAVDVCAMTVAGGVIIYGVDENDAGTRITEPTPFELAGVRERISQIAQNSIAEPPVLELTALEDPDSPGKGYVVAVIPPSPRAPHQVIVKGKYQGKFYGRDATGNRVLTEAEIAQYYARREKLEAEGDLDLAETLRSYSTVPYTGTPQRVYMAVKVRPVIGDAGLTERAVRIPGGSTVPIEIAQCISAGAGHQGAGGGFRPNLGELAGDWELVDADHWGAEVVMRDRPMLVLRIGRDGEATMCAGRVGDQPKPDGPIVVFEEAVAGLTSGVLAAVGELYERAGYLGAVDVGVLVRRLDGVVGQIPHLQARGKPYASEEYTRELRFIAGLLRDHPEDSARKLVGDLTTALVGEGYDPLGGGGAPV